MGIPSDNLCFFGLAIPNPWGGGLTNPPHHLSTLAGIGQSPARKQFEKLFYMGFGFANPNRAAPSTLAGIGQSSPRKQFEKLFYMGFGFANPNRAAPSLLAGD
ncbi:hypothetical protein QUF80_15530 [Desulfococcaceae bacterium HSG8]|nr:hypothetical protein [Desulfococcaceae bacterium HSG8]